MCILSSTGTQQILVSSSACYDAVMQQWSDEDERRGALNLGYYRVKERECGAVGN